MLRVRGFRAQRQEELDEPRLSGVGDHELRETTKVTEATRPVEEGVVFRLPMIDNGLEQTFFVAEMPCERRRSNANVVGNLSERGAGVAVTGEDERSGVNDLPAPPDPGLIRTTTSRHNPLERENLWLTGQL